GAVGGGGGAEVAGQWGGTASEDASWGPGPAGGWKSSSPWRRWSTGSRASSRPSPHGEGSAADARYPDARTARAAARACAIAAGGTGSHRPAPQRKSPGKRSRNHHAMRRLPGTQTSKRRCSIDRRIASATTRGGYLYPRNA